MTDVPTAEVVSIPTTMTGLMAPGSKYSGIEAQIVAPLMGDDGLVHFPSFEDQNYAEMLRMKLSDFSKHMMTVAGSTLNGPDIQRFSKVAFIHIVGHALQTIRGAWLYELNNRLPSEKEAARQPLVDARNRAAVELARYSVRPKIDNAELNGLKYSFILTDQALAAHDKAAGDGE